MGLVKLSSNLGTLHIIKIIIGIYIVMAVIIYALSQLMPLLIPFPPLGIDDFVVNKDSEVIIFSKTYNRFYIYSIDLKIRKTFRIPEFGNKPMLAVDEDNNIYILAGNSVVKYDANGSVKMSYSASSDSPRNWRLEKEGKIEHFSEIEDKRQSFSTMRLRRIAKPGDFLFLENRKADSYILPDSFTDNKGNKYVCTTWFSGIKIFNPQGQLIAHLKLPFFMRPFAIPFPGLFLFIISAVALVFIQSFEIRKKRKTKVQHLNR